MKRQLLASALAAALALPIVVGAVGTAQAADAIKMRVQTIFPSASMYFGMLQDMEKRINRMSGGRLDVEMLPVGAVVGFTETLTAVHQGIVEAGVTGAHFHSGKVSAAYLFADQPAVGGLDQLGAVAWFLEGDGNELYREMHDDHLKVNIIPFITLLSGGQPLGWFKNPIENLEDFQKLKYRSPPGITGELFTTMGITAVALPGGEIVPSAERGVIDAAEWINPGEDINLGLQDIWKNYYLQGFHQATDITELIINKDFWNKLPDDLQAIIETATLATITTTLTGNIYRNAVALNELQEKHGVKVYDTPPDLFAAFAAASEEVMAKHKAADPFFKKVAESQEEFAKVVVPYWTKLLALYASMGEAALAKN